MASGPRLVCEKEVRFAVVMYGGVSLAIYINGVAQELLRLVRATAPTSALTSTDVKTALPARAPEGVKALSGSERVYRKVSYLLSNQGQRQKEWQEMPLRRTGETEEDFQGRLTQYPGAPSREGGEADKSYQKRLEQWWRQDWQRRWLKKAEASLEDNGEEGAIRTRFIVDIISGTSAGGINGVFLAKALANGQDIRDLEQLWIDEGDIRLLINDRRSVEAPFEVQTPPASLLNSQRMYVKLLSALTGMDKEALKPDSPPPPPCQSPYVTELDLFVTTTDIAGVRLPIKLSDGVVFERRYRNVFQFRYDTKSKCRNDFTPGYNPFLAYASRCTSSFPFAFEPMMLTDIDQVLKHFPAYQQERFKKDREGWTKFYQRYVQPTDAQTPSGILAQSVEFASRAFGDGGYLDNRPFSYATETLAHRVAEVPVQRKLIYIEPSPEHPEDEPERAGRPNVAQNVVAALFTLPRYETIREDLQRVQERNRLITRIQRILSQVDADLKTALGRGVADEDEDKLKDFGVDYLSIYRASRDQQAKEETKPLNDDDWMKLDLADMVRRKGRAYVAYHRLEIGVVTDNLAAMVAGALNIEKDSDHYQSIRALIRAWRDDCYTEYRKKDSQKSKPTFNEFLLKLDVTFPMRRLGFVREKINQRLHADGVSDVEREELRSLRDFISEQFNRLLDLRLELAADERLADLRNKLAATGITKKQLDDILDLDRQIYSPAVAGSQTAEERYNQQEKECKDRASHLLSREKIRPVLDGIAADLSERIYLRKKQSDDACLATLNAGTHSDAPASKVVVAIRQQMREYYQNYDDYDMFIFPLQQGTDIGESALTEITRISPEDATNLIDEKKAGCLKLAGTALGHFGAFLQESWRRNDILWGRLDGAERLIAALLPDEPGLAQQLTTEAQAAIVCETIKEMNPDEMQGLLVESLMRIKAKRPAPDTLSCFINKLLSVEANADMQDSLEKIRRADIRDYYLKHYPRRSQLEPEPALRSAARATTVVGDILGDLSANRQLNQAAVWVTRLGRVFWGMVEVAVPQSLPNLMARYWVKLLYLFEAVLIAVGVFAEPVIRDFGLKMLALTLAAHFSVMLLSDLITGNIRGWRLLKLLKWLIAILIIAVLAAGFVEINSHLKADLCGFLDHRFGAGACGWVAAHKLLIGLSALGGVALFILGVGLYRLWRRRRPNPYTPARAQ